MKIEEILKNANLTEAQVSELVTAIRTERDAEVAKIRSLHMKEITSLTESREEMIKNIVSDSAEKISVLEERVKTAPRRVSATISPECAIGIDLDAGGTLCFTVTSNDGVVELSKPDSEAIKAWFNSLQETINKTKEELKIEDMKDEGMNDEELEESLQAITPIIRKARRAAQNQSIFAAISESVAPLILNNSEILEESTKKIEEANVKLEEAKFELEKENVTLRAQLEEMNKKQYVHDRDAILEEMTKGLALTTKEAVKNIVYSSGNVTLEEMRNFVGMVIKTTKPIKEVEPANKMGGNPSSSKMSEYTKFL